MARFLHHDGIRDARVVQSLINRIVLRRGRNNFTSQQLANLGFLTAYYFTTYQRGSTQDILHEKYRVNKFYKSEITT